MSFSIIISVGKYGGFYFTRVIKKPIAGNERRICLGWVAFSLLTPEFDEYLDAVGREVFGDKWDEELCLQRNVTRK